MWLKEAEVGKEDGNAGDLQLHILLWALSGDPWWDLPKLLKDTRAENWDPVIPGEGARRSDVTYVKMDQCVCKYIQTEHLCFFF